MWCISLKNHLEGSSVKVAVHISQESLKRKQFESCGAYISRVIKQFECCGLFISSSIKKEAV